MVWQVVWPACWACRAALHSIKVHMRCRLAPQPTIRRRLRRGQLVAQIIPLILQGVHRKAMPPLPANHKALLDCRRLRLSLKRIQEVQQQVIRIRNPIRTKDNRHVHQLCCAGCFPLTCRAVGKGNSSREDGVNNHQSSSAYLAHNHHLQIVATCTPARSTVSELPAPLHHEQWLANHPAPFALSRSLCLCVHFAGTSGPSE